MRQVMIRRDFYSPMKRAFKKFIKEHGFIWTGRFPAPLEWKSSDTVINAVWTPPDEPINGVFTIVGSKESIIADYLINDIKGVEHHDEMKRQGEYDEELKEYEKNYGPDFSKFERENAPQTFIDFKKEEWADKLQKKKDELYTKYMDSAPSEPIAVTTNIDLKTNLAPSTDDYLSELLNKKKDDKDGNTDSTEGHQ